MKTTLIKTIFTNTLLVLFITGSTMIVMISSCKKAKIVSSAEGNYIGSGITSAGVVFVNQIIKVTKLSNRRIRVEPVGHTYITAFEIDIERDETDILSKEDEDIDLGIFTDVSPYEIDFDAENTNESFSGIKQ